VEHGDQRAGWGLGPVREVTPIMAGSGGTLSGACPAGERRASAAAGRWLSGLLGRGQDGNGTMRCSRTQLDLMGHDPKPASR
jgi:hypothetical protein